MPEPDWDSYANFSRWEFECRCGCGRAEMDATFLFWLQEIRTEFDHPMTISSGFRCPDSDTTAARHRTGEGSDIVIAAPWAKVLLKLALGADVLGLGIRQHGTWNKRILHLDRIEGRESLWTYDSE